MLKAACKTFLVDICTKFVNFKGSDFYYGTKKQNLGLILSHNSTFFVLNASWLRSSLISGYSADIICLQEVDEKVFSKFLKPALELNGLAGVFQMKAGVIREGEALFYRTSKFRFGTCFFIIIYRKQRNILPNLISLLRPL